jgi:hypothetical protein
MSVSLIGQFGSSAFIFSVESGFQKPVAAIGTFRTSGHVGYSVAMGWKADIARIGRNRANDPSRHLRLASRSLFQSAFQPIRSVVLRPWGHHETAGVHRPARRWGSGVAV